jgi:hypothetical protein
MMVMSKPHYVLRLTHAPNGGFVIHEDLEDLRHVSPLVAAYSNKTDMLLGLSDLIEKKDRSDE